jgi:hypothetical protein
MSEAKSGDLVVVFPRISLRSCGLQACHLFEHATLGADAAKEALDFHVLVRRVVGLIVGRMRHHEAGWLRELATPSAANPSYGCLWWLNTGRKLVPSAPETSVFALGGGQNVIWVDEMRDLVMVVRLLVREHLDGLIARVIANLH